MTDELQPGVGEPQLPIIEVFENQPRLAGCLPRVSKPGELCPLFSEVVPDMTDAELAEAVGKVTLKHLAIVLDQDGVGSCATEAAAQAVMIARATGANVPPVLLNPWFIYHTTSGGRDGGSNIEDNLVFARDKGVVPESVWPRSKGWRSKPSDEAYAAAQNFRILEFYDLTTVRQMRTALAKGFPVVWGANGHALCKAVDVIVDDPEMKTRVYTAPDYKKKP